MSKLLLIVLSVALLFIHNFYFHHNNNNNQYWFVQCGTVRVRGGGSSGSGGFADKSMSIANTQPPLWGGSPIFSVLVNLTNPEPVANWLFAYYHDSNLHAERYEHFPPQYDEMCSDMPLYGGSDQQCNVIFATNGWSYLEFPKVKYCCKCENQFGAVKGNWLENNSTLVGIENLMGYQVQHWTKQGQYLNHYYCTNNDKIRIPIRFNELWGPKHILKQWDFKVETFNTKEFDRSLIDPPHDCENLCESRVCAAYRK